MRSTTFSCGSSYPHGRKPSPPLWLCPNVPVLLSLSFFPSKFTLGSYKCSEGVLSYTSCPSWAFTSANSNTPLGHTADEIHRLRDVSLSRTAYPSLRLMAIIFIFHLSRGRGRARPSAKKMLCETAPHARLHVNHLPEPQTQDCVE